LTKNFTSENKTIGLLPAKYGVGGRKMEITTAGLKERYSRLSEEDLLELYRGDDIKDEARSVLRDELERRGLAVPTDSEVSEFREEGERRHAKKRGATWSTVALIVVLFFIYAPKGREPLYQITKMAVLERFLPKKAAEVYLEKGLAVGNQGNHVFGGRFVPRPTATGWTLRHRTAGPRGSIRPRPSQGGISDGLWDAASGMLVLRDRRSRSIFSVERVHRYCGVPKQGQRAKVKG
jgi:hypothetical protein